MILAKFFKSTLTRHILVYFIVITLPILSKIILNAGIPVYVLLIILAVKFSLEELSLLNKHKVVRIICRHFSTFISFLFAMVLLLSIVITPTSIYAFFFEQAVNPPPTEEYYVASLFVLLVTFFCLFFGSASLKQKSYKPLLGLLSLIFGLLLIIYQKDIYPAILFSLLLITGLIIYITVIMKKRAIILLIVFVACIGISSLMFIVWSKPEGSGLVDNFLFPETRNLINNTFPEFPLLIEIPGYGLEFSTSRLGGRAILTSAPVFEIQGARKETIYLKTGIFDNYTGSSWLQSIQEIDLPDSLDTEVERRKGLTKQNTKPEIPKSDIFTVKILSEVFSMIPITIDTMGFTYKSDYYTIASNAYISGIAVTDGIKKNSIVTLYRGKKQQVSPSDLNLFLQVPEKLPESIKELATLLGQNASTRQEIIHNIQAFLAAHYTYNLASPVTKRDEDFLEAFLFQDKQGYCTHFATAFTILARLNGIPVRYVTGYLIYNTDDSFKKTVSSRTAHAWPEIWNPVKGWEIWESTRAVNRYYYDDYLESMYYYYMFEDIIGGNDIAYNTLTLNQLEDLLGIEIRSNREEKGFTWNFKIPSILPYILLFILVILIAGGLLYMVVRFILNRKPARYWKVLLNRIVKSLRKAPFPEEKGWIYWKNEVCSIYKIEEVRANRLLTIILRLAYSPDSVSGEEIRLLKSFK